MTNLLTYPVVIIGAGPIGLAAAAQLVVEGQSFLLFEKGPSIAHHVKQWEHVRMFSTWQYNISDAARHLLEMTDWIAPANDAVPTGTELIKQYLAPLAALPEIAPSLHFQHEILSISRAGLDKMTNASREVTPFELVIETLNGRKHILARAVIDASGVLGRPNPAVSSGHRVEIEQTLPIRYSIVNAKRDTVVFANQSVAVIGSGHSALNSLLELVSIKAQHPETEIHWILRKSDPVQAYGGEDKDALEGRGVLGSRIRQLVEREQINLHTGFKTQSIESEGTSFTITSQDGRSLFSIDHLIVNAGSRPDFSFLGEVRLDIDPVTESNRTLAPLIDPNLHSCGTVRPHGEEELRHPDHGIYLVGAKSYGRAPTFLLATGYEQIRSIVAYLVGDETRAKRIELSLPETGVCKISLPESSNSCCS
ncbi:NAD(P)-binding domain-containing protein [Exiguobacterium acetylicum]|uniref:NAD(P)-binding domain-containing protein n=1 Tax=Exiguobacterium acetylicum TaxID=41170 RepID=UPI003977C7E7